MVFGFGSSSSRLSRWEAKVSQYFLYDLSVKVFEAIAEIGVVVLMLITVLVVILRRTPLGGILTGGLELSELMVAMTVVFGLAFTWYIGGHLKARLLKLGPRWMSLLDVIACLAGFVWIAAVAWRMFLMAADSIQRGATTQMLLLPTGPFQFVFAVVMVHLCLVFLRSLLGKIALTSGRPVEHDGLY